MKKEVRERKNRDSEKGAALVMVLLISSLLLVASAGILLETSMNTANVTDSTAEQQAYNAAESGIQSAVNVLRRNIVPNPLINPSKPESDKSNRIDFRKAVTKATSNLDGDTSADARLSRWMTYNSTYTDRIALGSGTYNPMNGYAFSVTVTDPDDTGKIVSYNTTGEFYDARDKQWKSSIVYVSGANSVTVSYNSYSVSNLDVTGGSANTNFGSFQINGAGAITDDVRFEIVLNMTAPYTASRVIRGTLKAGTVTSSSIGTVKFDFDSPAYLLMGSTINITNDPLTPNLPNSKTTIGGNITPTEPYRVIVRSVGYGPRGARKELEAVVQKSFFNDLTAPATLTMIGGTGSFVFDAGNSQNVTYSGDDIVSNVIIPPVGTTNQSNLDRVLSELCATCKPNTTGVPADISSELPYWLKNTGNLDSTIQMLRTVAKSSGSYYNTGETPTNFGNNLTGTGITFVDGDVSYSGGGGGILVCTGKLTFHGGFDFKGLVIITGSDGLNRTGGGNGLLQGNIVIAPYDPKNLNAGFQSPKYRISGGGNSEVRFNSTSWNDDMVGISNFVLGVAEK